MRQEVPARALARRSRIFLFSGILIVLVGILFLTLNTFLTTVPLVVEANPAYDLYTTITAAFWWVGVLIIIIGALMALRAVTWKQDNPIAREIGQHLEQFLDTRYIFIRNVSRLRMGYIDAVLIGPAGVLVFRITNREGVFFNEGKNWMSQREKGKWTALNWSPTSECIDDMQSLREHLERRGLIDLPIYGAVVFTDDQPATIVTTDRPSLPVLQPQELERGLQTTYFSATDRLDQLTANKIARYLLG